MSIAFALLAAASSARAQSSGEATLGLGTSAYPYASNSFGESVFPSLNLGLQGASSGPLLEVSGKGEFSLYANKGVPYTIDVNEAYFGTSPKLSTNFSVSFGRRLFDWSRLDEVWQTGIWQPRFRYDPLHPAQDGLLGAFVTADRSVFHFVGYVSPFYMPEQGPPSNVQGGSVTSPSPWFAPPAAQMPIFGVPTAMNYALVMPDLSKILINFSAGALVRVGGDQGFWGQLSYGYMPMNQILLSTNADINISNTTSGPVVDATLYPRVLHHHLISLEGGYGTRRAGAWLGALADVPSPDTAVPGAITQQVGNALSFGPSIYYRFGDAEKNSPRLDLSYLHEIGGNLPDINPLSPGSTTTAFGYRYLFQDALNLKFAAPLPWHFGLSTQGIWDIGHQGLIWTAELAYYPTRKWRISVGGDLLLSGIPDASPAFGQDFISQYVNNDALHAGVSYAF